MIIKTRGSGLLDPVLNARAEYMHNPTTSGYCLSRFGRRLNPSYTSGICGDGYIAFVFLFVCSSVRSFLLPLSRSWNLPHSFLSGVYLSNDLSESIHILTIVTLEGWH